MQWRRQYRAPTEPPGPGSSALPTTVCPVTPPTPNSIFVCHVFGCKYRAEFDLTGSDRNRLAQLLAAGKSSAAAERKAVAAAGAWFDRRVGALAGTVNHMARAGMKYMYDVRQFDCIDSNTTSLLLVLDQLNMLRHRDVDLPESRAATCLTGGRATPPRCWSKGQRASSGRSTPGQSAMDSLWRSCRWSAGRPSTSDALQKAKRPRAIAGVFN